MYIVCRKTMKTFGRNRKKPIKSYDKNKNTFEPETFRNILF